MIRFEGWDSFTVQIDATFVPAGNEQSFVSNSFQACVI